MRLLLALAIAALAGLHVIGAEAQAPPLWYCDPLHVYYPAAPRCPVPWRPVHPSPSPTPSAQSATDSWQWGATDWRRLQAWFASQSGDRLAGANFWAANRSMAGHKSCDEAAADFAGDKGAFASGCLDAKARLDPIDAKRRSDPEYRAGFNSAARSAPSSAPPAIASNAPARPGGVASTAAQGPSLQYCDPMHPYPGAPMCPAPPETATNKAPEPDNGQALPPETGAQAPATADQVVPNPPFSSTEPVSEQSDQSKPVAEAERQVAEAETALEAARRDLVAAGALIVVVAIALYFLPTLIARSRRHHNAMAIFALNALLGWTFLGWVAALVWSLTAVERPGQASG